MTLVATGAQLVATEAKSFAPLPLFAAQDS